MFEDGWMDAISDCSGRLLYHGHERWVGWMFRPTLSSIYLVYAACDGGSSVLYSVEIGHQPLGLLVVAEEEIY
jgi:hypothetical protein